MLSGFSPGSCECSMDLLYFANWLRGTPLQLPIPNQRPEIPSHLYPQSLATHEEFLAKLLDTQLAESNRQQSAYNALDIDQVETVYHD